MGINSSTMEYISRRTERRNRRNEELENRRRNEDENFRDREYENERMNRKYENEIEDRHGDNNEKRKIGFDSTESKSKSGSKDILYEMEECLEGEIDDVVYYCEMCMEADMKGHREFSDAFYELAKEKLSCAEFIRLRLIQHGEYDPHKQQDIEERFDRAKHLFKRL